jgi:hypothetical protein
MIAVDEDWLAQLPEQDRHRAEQMLHELRAMGCREPEAWAQSEVTENIAQVARYRFLHQLWPSLIDTWRDGVRALPAAQRAINAGADPSDVVQIARVAAYEAVFGLLYHLEDDGLDSPLPSWALVEVDPAGTPTGRDVGGLFEDLLGIDPSGREGQDLWQ